ncbi:MAG: AurF N-oxygenase family protein [Acidimicrobiales bacterium]
MTDTLTLDEEQADRFTELVQRLSHQSVVKHFDAYADIAWDDPAFRIDPTDPRFELPPDTALGATAWYQALPAETRARLGLHMIVSNTTAGAQFESILKRGLLEYAAGLPDHSPEYRYVYHEVIEEAHHSLMFQEYVNRSGLEVPGLTWDIRLAARGVLAMARWFPEMFFVFVLGGEDPIDYVQRMALRSGRELHPLNERMMRIHVTEEARHLSFARQYLRHNVPKLSGWRRRAISVQAPITLAVMAAVMMRPSDHLVKTYEIPAEVLREAFGRGSTGRRSVVESLRKVRALLVELELVTPSTKPLWRRLGIWADDASSIEG